MYCCATLHCYSTPDKTELRKNIKLISTAPNHTRRAFLASLYLIDNGGSLQYEGNFVYTTFLLQVFKLCRNLQCSMKTPKRLEINSTRDRPQSVTYRQIDVSSSRRITRSHSSSCKHRPQSNPPPSRSDPTSLLPTTRDTEAIQQGREASSTSDERLAVFASFAKDMVADTVITFLDSIANKAGSRMPHESEQHLAHFTKNFVFYTYCEQVYVLYTNENWSSKSYFYHTWKSTGFLSKFKTFRHLLCALNVNNFKPLFLTLVRTVPTRRSSTCRGTHM